MDTPPSPRWQPDRIRRFATTTEVRNYVDIYITNLDGSGTTQVSDGVGYNVDPIGVSRYLGWGRRSYSNRTATN